MGKPKLRRNYSDKRKNDSELKFSTIMDDLSSSNDQLRVQACVALGNLFTCSDKISFLEFLITPIVMRKLYDRLDDRDSNVRLHAAGAVRQVQLFC